MIAGDSDTFLSVRIAAKSYGTAPVLCEIAFDVPRGKFVSILGPSGCGKATLLRMIAGLDGHYIGQIAVNGVVIQGPARQAGIMFQDARLLGWKSVGENIMFALPQGLSDNERQHRTGRALELVGLSKDREKWPSQLSGGMQRRVALARAIVNLPSLLLLDEPFSALDYMNKFNLWNEIEAIHNRVELTTLLVTHDLEEALYLSDFMIFLGGNPASIVNGIGVDIGRPRAKYLPEIQARRVEILAGFVA